MKRVHSGRIGGLAALAISLVAMGAVSAAAADGPVRLAVGGRTIVSLRENPTTGYVWHFDVQGSTNAAIVTVHDLGFERPGSTPSMVGAPGVHRWSVAGMRRGRARLRFINSRPWEGSAVRQHTIIVEVR